MKSEIIAKYNGVQYSAVISSHSRIVLRSSNSEDLKHGFEIHESPNGIITYIKYVERSEVDELYKKKIKGLYKNYEGTVLEEKGDKLLIMIDNLTHKDSVKLNMDEAIDKGMYEKWVNKKEVQIKVEKEIL